MILRLFLAISGLALLPPAAAHACSPAPGYRVPTNFELVQRAALIAIVQVDAGPEGSIASGQWADPHVRIGPMQVLKGVLPKQPLTLQGVVSRSDGTAFESAPTPLGAPHYSSLAGACVRQYYAKGGLILAMYEKQGDSLRPIGAPFSRALEDIESYDSLWVRAARLYIDMQRRARDGGLRDVVIAERDRLRGQGSDMEAQAIAADLDAWLDRGAARARPATGWRYDDEADEASVFTRSPGGADFVSLTCRRDGAGIELTGGRALRIGDRSFAADEGRIAFTPELARLLRHSAGPFAVAGDGRSAGQGGAGDQFQKLALRCETLLAP